ncbi:NAD(P)H-dependent oxidoreductase [Nakamurella flavida]|uniref:NAD(P)H-dependent oxidoreductase n=1 Tax=Nakamurella flavida TaxID=363630 RepID=A0A938YLT0_9ACTN|nr:NAD(P)H-dependent oxidoreductase [Nakamurella flavida]MBM9477048.1 NAD(P)H-dependent oxidoreductase [Nakamurella flavida]MDP9779994.1 NAD(P)H-dependent FMN reductase [Nakamurella flavida]
MSTLKIVIASTRPGRIGLPIGTWITGRAQQHGGFDRVEVLDLAEIALPFFDEPNHPRARDYQHDHTRAWSAQVDDADAFVFVTPEYNHGLTAPLKNALDYLVAEWAHKPLGIVSYGGISAGTRAAQMIKQIAAALKLHAIPEAVTLANPFPQVVDGEFVATQANDEAADAMLDELVRVEAALAPLRTAASHS